MCGCDQTRESSFVPLGLRSWNLVRGSRGSGRGRPPVRARARSLGTGGLCDESAGERSDEVADDADLRPDDRGLDLVPAPHTDRPTGESGEDGMGLRWPLDPALPRKRTSDGQCERTCEAVPHRIQPLPVSGDHGAR
jgi:hypothetical protein